MAHNDPLSSPSYRILLQPNEAPRYFLKHCDGGYAVRGPINFLYRKNNNENNNTNQQQPHDEFVILPVLTPEDQENQSDEEESVVPELQLARHVAIAHQDSRNGQWAYLSCRTKVPFLGSALCEPRNEINSYEVFRVEHCFSSSTYSFKSHNDLFLHYNLTLGTIAFKPVEASDAQWRLEPLHDHPPMNSDVIYLGILNIQDDVPRVYAECLPSVSSASFDRDFFNYILQQVKDSGCARAGTCSLFEAGRDSLPPRRWILQTDHALKTYVVITSTKCAEYLSVFCLEDLFHLFQDHFEQHCDNQDGITCPRIRERIAKAMFGTKLHYNQYNPTTDLERISDADRTVFEKTVVDMNSNLRSMMRNIESLEVMKKKAEELTEQAKVFRKLAKKLNHRWSPPSMFTIVLASTLASGLPPDPIVAVSSIVACGLWYVFAKGSANYSFFENSFMTVPREVIDDIRLFPTVTSTSGIKL